MVDAALMAAAAWHVATHEVLAVAAIGLVVSMLDDVGIDLIYIGLLVARRTRRQLLPPPAAEPGWMAIVIPAWDEADVIGVMLEQLLGRLDYPRFRVFVGVYPNDPATYRCVAGIDDARIVIVRCSRPGPTTKADCLNHLWRAVVADEQRLGRRFKAVVLHDAEDVVDADELHVFDVHLQHLAMVQLPVVPLIDAGSRWISGHYIDEFAEAHHKDIVVRGLLRAAVPSAGVACAIDRSVLGQLAGDEHTPFDPTSMTEDYELGLRIAALGRRSALVRCRGPNGTIVTREHFPATLTTAVRQKTRWLLGIALDGWDRIGWQTGFANRYMLLRDRKSVVAPLLIGLGYVAGAMIAVDGILRWAMPATARFAPLAPWGSPLCIVLVTNAGALGWRLGVRAGFTGRLYGWREGLRAVPRTVVGNLINVAAAFCAIRRYIRIRAGREIPRWDKTAHRFPDVASPGPEPFHR